MFTNRFACAAALGLALTATSALAGVPYPTKDTPRPVDQGRLIDRASNAPITVTIAMKLRDPAAAEAAFDHFTTKGDPLYRKWLTPAQFRAQFGPTDEAVAAVRATLGNFGLKVERANTTLLRVTGAPADLERAFGVSLHQYSVGATPKSAAYSFRAPAQRPAIPAAIAPFVHNVFGLDTRPAFHPHLLRAAQPILPFATAKKPAGAKTLTDPFGVLTVTDFAEQYDVNPLYKAGYTGAGHTLGIMTLASFTQSDAYTYWANTGLNVSPTRITEVPVDGGSGPPSDDAGSSETTLDVEQSGGVAPGSNIVVYEAPNTLQGFVDVFAAAIDANIADSLSISWGEWEWFDTIAANGPVTNPVTGGASSDLAAVHDLLLQAGMQGESTFAAAGDAGAYDVNRDYAPPNFSLALSVDAPASDPAITAAGGTTLPGVQEFSLSSGTVTVTIPSERVWSWDYLIPLCQDLGYEPGACGIFPVGGGGGVSIEWAVPKYQKGYAGVKTSQPDQAWVYEDVIPPQTIFALPAKYAGRNVPDVSFNADPDTGYYIGYTSSAAGSTYGELTFYGGTSFVAPQLNGVTQLLNQVAGGRLGLLNSLLYKEAAGFTGKASAIKPITQGNNDFYTGRKGYSPAAGLGTIDVSNLAVIVK
jgi:subtilase family serine protease